MYSTYCVYLDVYMCMYIYIYIHIYIYIYTSHTYDINHEKLSHYIYVFHLSKYYEFFDTFFMILNKNNISFLHYYHHSTVVIYTFLVYKYKPGGDYYLGPMLNSWVYIWMYLYYMLSSMINKENKIKYLWWNKYLTQMQIIQFFINTYMGLHHYFIMGIHDNMTIIGILYHMSFIYLFGSFYANKHKLC